MAKFSQYKAFVAVVELGSLSAAARKLNYSPSAMSKKLTALENSTSVQLLERSKLKVRVTRAGRLFYRQCKNILTAVTLAEDSLISSNDAHAGKISITLSKSLVRSPLFQILQDFSDLYPAIIFDIRLSDEIENLHDQDIDFAFRLGKLDNSSQLIAIPLTQVRLIFCATQAYFDQYGHPSSFQDLANHRLILLTPNYLEKTTRDFMRREKIPANIENQHTTNDIEAVYQATKTGLCIGMMLNLSIRQELKEKKLIDIFPSKPLPAKKLYLLYKKTDKQPQKQKTFKDFVKMKIDLVN